MFKKKLEKCFLFCNLHKLYPQLKRKTEFPPAWSTCKITNLLTLQNHSASNNCTTTGNIDADEPPFKATELEVEEFQLQMFHHHRANDRVYHHMLKKSSQKKIFQTLWNIWTSNYFGPVQVFWFIHLQTHRPGGVF